MRPFFPPCRACLLLSLVLVYPAAAEEASLDTARRLFLTGRYDEAAAQYKDLRGESAVEATAGLAGCLRARGEYDEAAELLDSAATKQPKASLLLARRAELAFEQGEYPKARELVDRALDVNQSEIKARWVDAQLKRYTGRLKEAEDAYGWFIDYQQQSDIETPQQWRYICLAAAEYARWNRDSDAFSDLVNHFFPQALELDGNYWPAHFESGRLFLEKYNEADASKSLQAALAINPNSADVHAALAELALQKYDLQVARRSVERALEINPRHAHALRMKADIRLANFQPEKAIEVLEPALENNPVDEATLGRIAAAYAMLDGVDEKGPGSRLGKLAASVLARNPHCGEFFFAAGQALDKGRKYPAAAESFLRATEVMPRLVGPRGQAGLMFMRLADEERARKLLEESFDIDPFNYRVLNTIRVLEVLDDYEMLETEHFVIRFDPQKDKILARYAADYLESIYPEMCGVLDFEPPEKSLFEIFNDARNTKGHGWFSARMVGLPNIHTIAACGGKMVAMTSPGSMPQRFNWARVLKHEFVHVINLQQTRFNIPHWFTEALAVWFEDTPRPAEWNEMLARRVPAGEMFDLSDINMAFIRPASSEDWQMAYCQAELYAEYMLDRFGKASLAKMLAAYRDNLNTRDAIRRSFDVSVEEFEKGYREYVEEIAAKLKPAEKAAKQRSFSELQKAYVEDPENLDLAAELALEFLARKSYAKAGKLVDRVLEEQPKHPLGTYVKAKLLLLIGQREEALKLLSAALDEQQPRDELLRLLAGMKYQAKDYEGAAKLYELGRKQHPDDPAWTKSLAMVYLKAGDDAKVRVELERLAEVDADDLTVRKKLAQLALARKDFAAAADWANQCLQIDVLDAAMHALYARALHELENYGQAAREYQVALELTPENSGLLLPLAKSYAAGKQPEKARNALLRLFEAEPDNAEAAALLKSLPE